MLSMKSFCCLTALIKTFGFVYFHLYLINVWPCSLQVLAIYLLTSSDWLRWHWIWYARVECLLPSCMQVTCVA